MIEEDMILDLQPDDAHSIFRRKTMMQWDRRRKKYIQVTQGHEKKPKFIKNEAGQLIKLDAVPKGKLYSDWMSKSKKTIPKIGELEQLTTSFQNYEQSKKRAYQKYKNTAPTSIYGSGGTQEKKPGNHPVKNELRTPEQIRKMKKEKLKKNAIVKGKKRKRNPPNVPRKKQKTGIRMLNY